MFQRVFYYFFKNLFFLINNFWVIHVCFIIWNAISVLLFILFPCKSVIKKTINNFYVIHVCFIIWNAISVLLFLLFPCKSVTEKTTVLLFIIFPCKLVTEKTMIIFSAKPIYSRKQVLCFSASKVRRDSNKFKYSSKLKG